MYTTAQLRGLRGTDLQRRIMLREFEFCTHFKTQISLNLMFLQGEKIDSRRKLNTIFSITDFERFKKILFEYRTEHAAFVITLEFQKRPICLQYAL